MADAEERARRREERRRRRKEQEERKDEVTEKGDCAISDTVRSTLNGDPDISRETVEGLEQKSDAALPDVVKVPSGLNEDWERPTSSEIDKGYRRGKNGYKSYSNAIAAEGQKSGLEKKREQYTNTAMSAKRYDSDEDAEFEPEVQSPRGEVPDDPPSDEIQPEDEWSKLSPQRTTEREPEDLSETDGGSESAESGNRSRRISDEWKSASKPSKARGVNKPKSKLKKSDSWIRERPELPEEPVLKEPEWLDLVRKRRWRSTVKARFPQSERERIQFERRLDTSKKGLKFNPRGEPTGITGPDMDDELSLYLLQQRRRIQSDDVYESSLPSPSRSRISSESRRSSERSISESEYSDSLFDQDPRNRELAAEKGILNLSRPPIKGPTKEVHKNLAMERSRQSTMKWRFSIDPLEEPLWTQLPRPTEIEAINDMDGNLEAKFWASKKKFQTGQFNPPPVLPKPRSRSSSGALSRSHSASEADFGRRPTYASSSETLNSEEMIPTASRSTVKDMRQRLATGDFQTSTPLPQKPVELQEGYIPRLRDLQQRLAEEAENFEVKAPKPDYISPEELASMGNIKKNISEETFQEKIEEPKPLQQPRFTRRRSDAEFLDLLASRKEEADASATEMAEEISSVVSDISKAFGKSDDEEQQQQEKQQGKEEPQTQQQPKQHATGEESKLTSPEFLVKLKDFEVLKGNDISFETVVSGEPQPAVEWYLDDRLVKSDKRHKVVSQGAVHSLTITDVRVEDEGIYECVAINSAGEASCDCELLVND